MDTSLAGLTGQPTPFEHDGVTYQLHPLQLKDIGAIQAWCDSRYPSPFKAVSEQLGNGLFTPAQEKALLEAAIRVAASPKPQIGSPECDAMIGSTDGIAKFVHLSVGHGDPKFTEAQAKALVGKLDVARLEEVMAALDFQSMIGGREEGDPGPKAPAGGTSSTLP